MEAVLFLQALDWLVPQQANASSKQFQPSPCATGPASSCLSCKTRFHICLSEQHTPTESIPAGGAWRGPFAQGAVQLRLRLPDGSCKSTLDATVTAQLIPQDQGDKASGLGQAVVVITWFGQDYQIETQDLVKVVCSEGVHKAAAAVSDSHTHPCLLAAVNDTQQQLPNAEWACLITKHVCLNLMIPDEPEATAHLARVVATIHAAACCCSGSAEGSNTPRSVCQHNTTLPAHVHDLDSFLSLASSEAQIMQLLLGSNKASSNSGVAGQGGRGTALQETAARRYQERHLLDAVGHMHASHRPG